MYTAQSGVRAWARERVPEYSGRAPIVLPTISAVHHGPSSSAMVPHCGRFMVVSEVRSLAYPRFRRELVICTSHVPAAAAAAAADD